MTGQNPLAARNHHSAWHTLLLAHFSTFSVARHAGFNVLIPAIKCREDAQTFVMKPFYCPEGFVLLFRAVDK